ncbi:MAG: hypothetical protein IT371_04910 [Deltaproteobacteria bacterium]|nr:hypothetical protein [Deltaproteobacteria bacterium]
MLPFPLLAFAALALCACSETTASRPGVGDGGAAAGSDAVVSSDGAARGDGPAGPLPDGSRADSAASVPCGEFDGATRFTCAKDGWSRGKCVAGKGTVEKCERGCLRKKAPDDDVCMGTTDNWSCTAVQGTSKAENGDYYITYFGCWVDDKGVSHKDPNDNCLPGCFNQAKAAGLCQSSWTGQQCEEKTVWFTANNGRFPCLSRLRIINPANGRKVIAVVLDGGPACTAEKKIGRAMLDTSAPVFNYLFENGKTWSTKVSVHVVEVDGKTPLGIEK